MHRNGPILHVKYLSVRPTTANLCHKTDISDLIDLRLMHFKCSNMAAGAKAKCLHNIHINEISIVYNSDSE